MSISEIALVLLVALLVVKPEDVPEIIKAFKKIFRYFHKIKKDIASIFEDEAEDVGEINKYLLKISALDSKYEGDYTLEDIRAFYHKLLKERRNNE